MAPKSQSSLIPETLAHLAVPIDTLIPYPGNARRGNVDVVVASLRKNGQYRPIVVNKRGRIVLAGNHTLKAMITLGQEEIAATFVDVNDEQAARINLVDNRASDIATYDTDELLTQLRDLGDLDGTGYGQVDLDALLKQVEGELLPEPGDAEMSELESAWGVIVECDSEAEQIVILARLMEQGLQCKAMMA